jgi:hypothetical protein
VAGPTSRRPHSVATETTAAVPGPAARCRRVPGLHPATSSVFALHYFELQEYFSFTYLFLFFPKVLNAQFVFIL